MIGLAFLPQAHRWVKVNFKIIWPPKSVRHWVTADSKKGIMGIVFRLSSWSAQGVSWDKHHKLQFRKVMAKNLKIQPGVQAYE